MTDPVSISTDGKCFRPHVVRPVDPDLQSWDIEEYVFSHGNYLVGRFPQCDIRLTDPSASRVHARLVFGSSGLRVSDLGSSNGTYLDGRRIKDSQALREGTLSIGSCKLLVFAVMREYSAGAELSQLRVTVLHPESYSSKAGSHQKTKEIPVCERLAEDCEEASEEGLVEVSNSGRLDPGSEPYPERGDSVTSSALLSELEIGDYVEFEFSHSRGIKRVLRLKSIGGNGSIYFFHAHQASESTLSITAERLSRYFRERSARVLRC